MRKMTREGEENKERGGSKEHETVKTQTRHVYGSDVDDT